MGSSHFFSRRTAVPGLTQGFPVSTSRIQFPVCSRAVPWLQPCRMTQGSHGPTHHVPSPAPCTSTQLQKVSLATSLRELSAVCTHTTAFFIADHPAKVKGRHQRASLGHLGGTCLVFNTRLFLILAAGQGAVRSAHPQAAAGKDPCAGGSSGVGGAPCSDIR